MRVFRILTVGIRRTLVCLRRGLVISRRGASHLLFRSGTMASRGVGIVGPAGALLLIVSPVVFARQGPDSIDPCSACMAENTPDDLLIGPSRAESLGTVYAERNADAIRQAAADGGIGDDIAFDTRSMERARLLFQLRAWDGIRLIAELAALSPGYVTVGPGDPLEPLREHYENVAVYPLRFIQRARLGNGVFCLIYDIPRHYDERIRIGKLTLRTGAQTVKLSDRGEVPVLLREYPLAEDDTIDMLFESRICGKASVRRIEDRGDSLELVTLEELQGVHVRKAGVHRLGALMMWRSLPGIEESPHLVRMGACAYFPKLTFSLPLFLPDFGLDDLRDFGYPQPVLPKTWLLYPERHFPRWAMPTASGTLDHWQSRGPRPLILETLFPDL